MLNVASGCYWWFIFTDEFWSMCIVCVVMLVCVADEIDHIMIVLSLSCLATLLCLFMTFSFCYVGTLHIVVCRIYLLCFS